MYDDLQLEPSSTVDRAAEEIRRALFAGLILPGSPLREVALSEAMNVGRSTIREALGVLVGEGVAVRIPNRGVTVKELTVEDVHDVIRARLALEIAGVHSWQTAAAADRRGLREAFERYVELGDEEADPAALTEAHLQIHRSMVGLTGSERLLAATDSWGAEIRLGLAQLDRTRGNKTAQVSDHRRLVELVERGDIDVAVEELRQHLEAAETSLLEAIGAADTDRRGRIGA